MTGTAARRERMRGAKVEGRHTREDEIAQWHKQKQNCFWCLEPLALDVATADHYVPLSKGGTDAPSNVVMSCRSCNSKKWRHDPEVFAERTGRYDLLKGRVEIRLVSRYASEDVLARSLDEAIREALKPPPRLTVAEWADRYAQLSPETSSNAGPFRSFGYQREIMNACADPHIEQVVVMKSSRVGFTRCLDNVVGYYIHQDPAPILLVQPRVEDAEDYSRTEIAPMLRDTEVLREIMGGEQKARDPDQRILKRTFKNGASIAFVGANSPGGFRRITARVVGFDEVDGYPPGAGDEGDQIKLGIKRSETYWNRVAIIGSTPTKKGKSRIETAYAASDQRRYHVPCPHCGHMQTFKWANLRWDKNENNEHLPNTAHFVCEGSGCIIEEHHKPRMIEEGEWRASRPFTGTAGFHIWTAYSLFPNASWARLVKEFLEVRHDPLLLRTFVNTTLGETWEDKAETVEAASLSTRGENYGPQSIPRGALLMTAGVDVQGDRLEVTVLGFGIREECWAIEHEVLFGDPSQETVWQELDGVLLRKFANEDGRELRIRAACIDIGGHHANEVLSFCKRRRARRVFAIKGTGGPRPIWPRRFSRLSANVGNGNETFFAVGVDTAKDTIYGRLRIEKIGPAYAHFPVGLGFDAAYFDQLTSERVVTRYKEGRPYRVWEKPVGRRNEALDCYVYALAARMSLPYRLDGKEDFAAPPPPPPDNDEVELAEERRKPEPPQDEKQKPRHSSFQNQRPTSGWFDRRR